MGVGAIGFVLQLSSLALMTMVADWPYQLATALAVELAVVHNFVWHERWTWRERTERQSGLFKRFVRYQITTGATSLAGNLLFTVWLVERAGVPPLAGNVAAVGAMSVANFLLYDRWVFAKKAIAAAAAIAVFPSPASAGDMNPETLAAWNKYIDSAEDRLLERQDTAVQPGPPRGEAIGIPGGTIHRWRGSTVIRGIGVDDLVHALKNPGTPPPQNDVLEARVLEKTGDSLHVYLKLVRRTIITATYDTEHRVTFWREGPGVVRSRSVSTKIAESGGGDRGFLWRLNSYWRYVQAGNDVVVELESVSLSRSVPTVLKPVAGPIIGRVGRESVTSTLDAMRDFFEKS
jgi:putative flippase GtrA